MSWARRLGARVGHVLAWAVTLSVIAALAVAVVVPRAAGGTPYAVLTGSMRPDLGPGTLVVVRPTPVDEIGIGDVVTYQLESGKPTVVTHRVVGVGVAVDGERVLQTKGDANEVVDPEPVREVQVKGKLWYSVPYLGHANTFLTSDQRQWAVYGIAALLLAYAALMWGGAALDRRRRRTVVVEEADDAYASASS
jgi:signal peptidase